MKKTLALLLALCMAFSMFSVVAFADNAATYNVALVDEKGNAVTEVKAGESVWAVISVANYENYVGDSNVDWDADDIVLASEYDKNIAVITTYLELDTTAFTVATNDGDIVWESPYKADIADQGGDMQFNLEDNVLKTLLRTDSEGGVYYAITKSELDANNGELFRIKLDTAADAAVGNYSVALNGGDGVTVPGLATITSAAGEATVTTEDVTLALGAAANVALYNDDVAVEVPDSYTIVDSMDGFDYADWTVNTTVGSIVKAEADKGSYTLTGAYASQRADVVYNDVYYLDGLDAEFAAKWSFNRYHNNNLRQDAEYTYGGVALGGLEFRVEGYLVPQIWYNGELIAEGDALVDVPAFDAVDEEGNPIYADWAAYIEAVKLSLVNHNSFAFTYGIKVVDGVVNGYVTYVNADNQEVTVDAVSVALPEGAFAEAVQPAAITQGTMAYVAAVAVGAKFIAEKAITDVAKNPIFENTFASDVFAVTGTLVTTETAYGDFIKLQRGTMSATTKKAYNLGNEFHAGVKTLRQYYNRMAGDYSALTVGDLTVKVVTCHESTEKFNSGGTDIVEVYVAGELVATSEPIKVKSDSAAYEAAGVNSAHSVGYVIAIDYVDGVITVDVNGTVLTVEAALDLNDVTMTTEVKTIDWSNSIAYMPYLYDQKAYANVDLGLTNAYVAEYVIHGYDNVPSYMTTAANVGDLLSDDQAAILTKENVEKAKAFVLAAKQYASLGDVTLNSYLVYGLAEADWTKTSGSFKTADYGTYVQGSNSTDIKVTTKNAFDLSNGFEMGVGYGKIYYNTKAGYNFTIKVGDVAVKISAKPDGITDGKIYGGNIVEVSVGDTVVATGEGTYVGSSDFKTAVGSATVTADKFVYTVLKYENGVLTVTVNDAVVAEGAIEADLTNATVALVESKLTGWSSSFAYDFYLTAGERVINLFELNTQMGTLANVVDFSKYSPIAATADEALPQIPAEKKAIMNNIAVYEAYKEAYVFVQKGVTYNVINGFYADEWTDVKTIGGNLVRGDKEIAYLDTNSETAYKTVSYPNTALYMENVRGHQTMTSAATLNSAGYFKIVYRASGVNYQDRYIDWKIGDLAIRATLDAPNTSPDVNTGMTNMVVFQVYYKGEVIHTITGEANDLGYDKSVDGCSPWMYVNCEFTITYNNGNLKITFYNGDTKYVTAKDGLDLTALEGWDGAYTPDGNKVELDVYTSYSQFVVTKAVVSGKASLAFVDTMDAMIEADPAAAKRIYDSLSDKTIVSAAAKAILDKEFTVTADENAGYTYTIDGYTNAGDYRYGDTITLAGDCAEGYAVEGWYDAEGNLLSAEETYTVKVEPGVSIVVKAVECTHQNVSIVGAADATCGEDGHTGNTVCDDCGETLIEGDVIPATGEHAWGEFVPNEDGLTETKTCGTCGATETQDIVVEECAHEWGEWEITTEATSTTAGVKTRTCGLCGATETQEFTIATSGTTGDVTWRFENGTLYIEGTGAMGNYVNVGDVAPWQVVRTETTAIVIGDGVTYIGNRAFKGFNRVTSVTIGKDVATTGYECFYNCTALATVDIQAENLTAIGALCFYNCGFESIEIPATVTNLANRAFKNCKNLTAVEMPNAVTTTGYEVFMGCVALEDVTISTKLNMINPLVFSGCTGLTEIEIPANITRVRTQAFANTALETVIFEDDDKLFPSSTEASIASDAFANCASTMVIKGFKNGTANVYANARGFAFQATNTSEFKYTLDENNNATITGMRGTGSTLTIPETVDGYTVVAIGTAAFRDNTGIKKVVIPATVTTINGRAFQGCSALTTVIGLENVTTIAYNAFYNCDITGELYVPSTVAVANATVFQGNANVVIKTQEGSTAAKYAASADLTVKIVTNFDYDINEDGESVTVTGVIGTVTDLVIPDEINGYKVTNINQRAFKNNTDLQTVVIGNNVTELKYEMFMNCTNITTVTVGSGVTATGANTFGGMTSLESITFLSSDVNFHANTFLNSNTALTVYGVAGSSVQTFVEKKGFTFVAL